MRRSLKLSQLAVGPPSDESDHEDRALLVLALHHGFVHKMPEIEKNWFDQYIHSDPKILSGTPVIRGTRIPAAYIAGLVRGGTPIERVLTVYDWLSRVQIDAAIAYQKSKGH